MSPSKIRVAVTVASDTEPMECEGVFCGVKDGFTLEFRAGETSYVITHDKTKTKLVSSGLLSYEMDFTAEGTTSVNVPFGSMEFKLVPETYDVAVDGEKAVIALCYRLIGADTDIRRSVNVTARFLR